MHTNREKSACTNDIITKSLPPYPPAAVGPVSPDVNAALSLQVTDFWGNLVEPFYVHGHWLLDQQSIENDLKMLLIRCLADQPAHRPILEEFTEWMNHVEAPPEWRTNPDDHDWFQRTFAEPPSVRIFFLDKFSMSKLRLLTWCQLINSRI